MRRHAKASSSGSSTRQGSRPGALTIVAAFALVFVAFLGIGASAAMADNTPSVATNAAESVGVTTAKLSGSVNPNGEAGTGTTTWRLEYTPAGAGTWATANSGEITGTEAEEANPVSVEAIFGFAGELHPGSEYEFRLVAENGAGQATSSIRAFTMQPATAPLLTANAASAVEYTTATLHGELDPAGGNENIIASEVLPIHWQLQYSLAGQGSWSTGGEGMIENAEAKENGTPITLSAPLSSGTLQPGSEYESRLVAFYASPAAPLEEASSPGPAFTTLDVTAPTVSADAASAITASSAKFTGTVTNGNSDPAFNSDCKFEYVTDAQFNAAKEGGFAKAQSIACQPNPVEGAAATPVEAEATGLEPHQTYHLRLSATNVGGTTSDDAPSTFTTAAIAPSVQTIYVGNLHATSATLRGWVNPHNSQTSYYFLWGTEDCSANPCQSIPLSEDAEAGSGGTAVSAQQTLTGLSPETTYHYLLVATNSAGTEEALDRTFTTAASDQGACPNEARRAEQPRSDVLGDCRAWELASPGTSIDIVSDTGRTVAAAGESPGLPMAAKFSAPPSGDVEGAGALSDFLTQRDGAPGTSGWSVHGLTPPQEARSFLAGGQNVDPLYELFNPDLTGGFFRSWSSLPGTPTNVAQAPNLYLRTDVRNSGNGNYALATDSENFLPTPFPAGEKRPWIAGASVDLEHVVFETKSNLTADAIGNNVKLYKSDHGVVRLIKPSSACAGASGAGSGFPCSMAGIGAMGGPLAHYTPHVISSDGSRVNFTSPAVAAGTITTRPGVVSKLYQLDDGGTASKADDAVIQINASESPSPEAAAAAIYQDASVDGSRVFFTSNEQLTSTPGNGLYMWQRQPDNETQSVTVDATEGTFTLTAHAQPSVGQGTLTEGSTEVTAVTGSFTVGQTISAPGIPAGTTVTEVGRFSESANEKIVLSAPATENGVQALSASFSATTASLAWNASAPQVAAALEALSLVGTGNVAVTGGPGGTSPFEAEFTGTLAGVDVMPLTTDASGLSGGASTATVTTTNDVHNLTLIAAGGGELLGAAEDGTRVYYSRTDEIYLWTDDGTAAGSTSFVASLFKGDNQFNLRGLGSIFWNFSRKPLSRVSPDGRFLLFEASSGAGLPPAYAHGPCLQNENATFSPLCSEAYVYRADSSTPADPDIVCASCNLAVPGVTNHTFLNIRYGVGSALTANHLSRALTNDGRRVFFDTDEALVSEDTNGAVDVYEYDVPSGEAHLVSSGTDSSDSYLMDANADGSDVFFTTRQQLAGWDDDLAYDLYDARVDGGFANPPVQTAACQGESCRSGGAPATPGATAPGSASLVGPGNAKPTRKTCPKGKRAVKKNGKTRCVKKHNHKHTNHKRTANTNRRAGR